MLRHDPGRIGITLSPEGWASMDELIRAASRAATPISREAIHEVVTMNDKQRFSLSTDQSRIRARQGHSIEIDLGLTPTVPPEILFHGTVARHLSSIRESGLEKRKRQHVHLSPDEPTARRVGARRGRPIVLLVEARRLAVSGVPFFLLENGVWLTDRGRPSAEVTEARKARVTHRCAFVQDGNVSLVHAWRTIRRAIAF